VKGPVLDFTSALYLGMRHESRSLRPWERLTLGVPAALVRPPGAARVEQALSALVGRERSLLFPSTLHVFWDLFGILSRRPLAVHLDAGVYPIVAYGVERAAWRGAAVHAFRHHDAAALTRSLRRAARRGVLPVVVVDGLCPGCGRAPPLRDYHAAARAAGGVLIMDDTQALGLLGARPDAASPYGEGGGGSLRYHDLDAGGVLLGSSLAKSFGVPVAALSGGDPTLLAVEAESEIRVHASPPSVAVIHAAEHALAENAARGDALRRRLAANVRHLRERLIHDGWAPRGELFPVQALDGPGVAEPSFLSRLLELGVRGVLYRSRCAGGPSLGLVVTAAHDTADLDRCADALSLARRGLRRSGSRARSKEVLPCG
jgi:8-amino-7-oxononanoate synthase